METDGFSESIQVKFLIREGIHVRFLDPGSLGRSAALLVTDRGAGYLDASPFRLCSGLFHFHTRDIRLSPFLFRLAHVQGLSAGEGNLVRENVNDLRTSW